MYDFAKNSRQLQFALNVVFDKTFEFQIAVKAYLLINSYTSKK